MTPTLTEQTSGAERWSYRSLTALQLLNSTASLLVLFALIFLLHLGSNPEFGFVFAGAAAIHFGARPSRRELGIAAVFAAAFAAAYLLAGAKVDQFWVSRVAGLTAALGFGSLAVLCLRAFAGPEGTARSAREALRGAAIIPVFGIFAAITMQMAHDFPARTFDLYLYKFDGQLGFEASFWCGMLFQRFPWLSGLSSLVYNALAFLPALVFGVAWRERRRLPFNPLIAFVAAGFACFFLYQICPGTAPSAVFGGRFPANPPAPGSLTLSRIQVPGSPRNAMPSMHATWTLLAWWCALRLRPWMRTLCTVFLAITLLATLGFGEHYVADLIVAFAFAVAISAGCCRDLPLTAPPRRRALAVAGCITLAWLVLLREGLMPALPPLFAWIAVIATVSVSCVMQIRLLRAHAALADPH